MSADRPGRKLALRRQDLCCRCGAELPVGTTAWWEPVPRTVTCLACVSDAGSELPVDSVSSGQAGASALREHQSRHVKREEHARKKLGKLGVVLARVVPEPSSTRVWRQGGDGEVRVGKRLDELLGGTGVRLLHDRRVPEHGNANIDHIAVGPGGVTVIDTKTHTGKIRKDWSGGLFTERRTILRIDGRDQTKLITGVEMQIAYVRSALSGFDSNPTLDIAGAVCFPDIEGLPWMRRIEVSDILVDGPAPVGRLAARPGLLESSAVEDIWTFLGRSFPPA